MIDITRFAELVPGDHGLAVVTMALPDGTVHASIANAGVLDHPVNGAPIVGIVAAGESRKLTTSESTRAPQLCCASAGGGLRWRDRSSWLAQTTCWKA